MGRAGRGRGAHADRRRAARRGRPRAAARWSCRPAARARLAERDPARAARAFAAVEETGREALAEMRRLLGVLRREDEELALAPQPSLAHVAVLVAPRARRRPAGRRCASRASRAPLPAGVDLTAYRRRAGGARRRARAAAPRRARRCTVRYAADARRARGARRRRRATAGRCSACASAWRSTAASCSAARAARRRPGACAARLPVGSARVRRPGARVRPRARRPRARAALFGARPSSTRSPTATCVGPACAQRSSPSRRIAAPLACVRRTRPLRGDGRASLGGRAAGRVADLGRRPARRPVLGAAAVLLRRSAPHERRRAARSLGMALCSAAVVAVDARRADARRSATSSSRPSFAAAVLARRPRRAQPRAR